MQYILNSEDFIEQIGFGTTIKYEDKESIPYIGNVPDNYESLDEWFNASIENNSLNAWKIVDNNLVFDENKYNELLSKYEEENNLYSRPTRKEVDEKINKTSSVVLDEFSTNAVDTKLVVINDSGAYNIPKVELTGEVNEDITVIVSNKNILNNKAVTSTINGVTFFIAEDKTITLNGTATSDIEFTLDGSVNNTKMLFLIKENKDYVISGLNDDIILNLYSFDGTDKTLVYSGPNANLYLTESNIITEVTLNIASGKTFDDITIAPQIERSDVKSEYEMHLENKIIVSPSEQIVIEDELYSYNPTTIIMVDKDMAISVDYFKYKSLNTLSSGIEVLDERITASVSSVTTLINNEIDGVNSTIDNQYTDLVEKLDDYATNSEVITLKSQVEAIATDSQYAIEISKDLQENGVSKVKTSTGFTFDEDGLTIAKSDATTKTNINENGMVVYSTTGTDTKMLEANSTGVIAENLTSNKYFICGTHSRFENYEDGTGCFYLG